MAALRYIGPGQFSGPFGLFTTGAVRQVADSAAAYACRAYPDWFTLEGDAPADTPAAVAPGELEAPADDTGTRRKPFRPNRKG